MEEQYWTQRYQEGATGWDVGEATRPLRTFIDQIVDRDTKILIPGSGNAYEAAYLHRRGFAEVYVLDISAYPLQAFRQQCPDFPEEHLVHQDFFTHQSEYDLILEQAFFCALPPVFRPQYARKMHELLRNGGQLVGVLFDDPLYDDHPPYGGNRDEYFTYFAPYFRFKSWETCYNSIPPRQGRELFIHLVKEKVSDVG